MVPRPTPDARAKSSLAQFASARAALSCSGVILSIPCIFALTGPICPNRLAIASTKACFDAVGMGKAFPSNELPGSAGMEILMTKAKEEFVSLTKSLSKPTSYKRFSVWLVGDTPLITHAWSEKAKREMLQKQVKAVKGGKEVRDPDSDFTNSLYDMGDGSYGFPVTGVKNCILSAAHKDRGVARSAVLGALWLEADMVRTRPALSKAICDMPLVRIFGSKPEMREDMVKIGAGLNKIANLAYRSQFTIWAMKISGKFNSSIVTDEALGFLIMEAGMSSGLGEWRNERKGVFGAFHLADDNEMKAWDLFKDGKGPLPVPASYQIAAE